LAGNSILALSGLTLFYYLLYFDPVGFIYFVAEDYWAESATFASFFMASGIVVWTLVKDRGYRTPGLFLLALGAFLVAMEEISWGQRLLGIRSPDFFAAKNVKGEMNLHNFIDVDAYYSLVAIGLFLYSILLPLFTRKSIRLHRWCRDFGIPLVPVRLWPLFLLAVYFFADHYSLKKSEVGEMYLGLAIAALSLDLALTMRRGEQARGALAAGATAGMLLSVGILTAVLVQLYPWPEKLRYNLNRFAAVRFPSAGMHRQAAMLFDYMDQNPQFLMAETPLHHGALLMRMGRHAKAKTILERVLAEQEHLRQQHPDDPGPYRNAGMVLALLARPQEAERAFVSAIEKYQARLDRAAGAATKSSLHQSLGETFLMMGNSEAASKHFTMARALNTNLKTQLRIRSLMK